MQSSWVALYIGDRYSLGFCATIWKYARERIDILVKKFPNLSHEMVAEAWEDNM